MNLQVLLLQHFILFYFYLSYLISSYFVYSILLYYKKVLIWSSITFRMFYKLWPHRNLLFHSLHTIFIQMFSFLANRLTFHSVCEIEHTSNTCPLHLGGSRSCHIISYYISYHILSYHIISYYLFSFCGSLQDYKIHMGMEIVNTLHKSNKNVC